MTEDRWAGVPDLLSRLEDLELRLLSWGVVDGSLSVAEVDDAIEAQLELDAGRGGVVMGLVSGATCSAPESSAGLHGPPGR